MNTSDRPIMLEADALGFTYGTGGHRAISDLSFAARRGEFVSIVGPSGAGKTTLLRCLSGLMRPTEGEVRMAGSRIESVPVELALVFQDYSRSLYPWKTVARNVAFPLKAAGVPKEEIAIRVAQSLEMVGLADFHNYYSWQLSGGMQQRVAIARAIAYRPSVLLMDEPFASVDAQTRSELEDLVLRLRDEIGMTILFVTHDVDESVYLSDRVLVLSASPAHVIADLPVDLPYPRDQITTREDPVFVNLRGEVARLIRAAGTAKASTPTV